MNAEILLLVLILILIIGLILILIMIRYNHLKQQIYLKEIIYKSEKLNNNEISNFKSKMSDDLINFQSVMSNSINSEINRLNENTTNRLVSIENSVNDGLIYGFNKTNESFNNVLEQITRIDEAQENLKSFSSNLTSLQNVLTDKKTRGIYGEINLYSLLENIYGNNDSFYKKQYKLSNGNIADCVIIGNRSLGDIVIDSKFPMENYNKIYDSSLSVDQQNKARNDFKKDVLKHIYDIKNKYIIPYETAEIAFMFIPAEAIFAEIYSKFDDVIQKSYEAKVYLVSPTTLMAYISALQAIYIEQKRNDKILLIQKEFGNLSIEFKRFQDRFLNLNKDFEKTYKDMNNMIITSDKIINRFQKIEAVEFQEEDD